VISGIKLAPSSKTGFWVVPPEFPKGAQQSSTLVVSEKLGEAPGVPAGVQYTGEGKKKKGKIPKNSIF